MVKRKFITMKPMYDKSVLLGNQSYQDAFFPCKIQLEYTFISIYDIKNIQINIDSQSVSSFYKYWL